MPGRDVTFRGVCEAIGIAGLLAYVFNLKPNDAAAGSSAAADNVSTIARMDDEAAPLPELIAYQDVTPFDPTVGMAGLAGLGAAISPLPLTDEPAAPLKLRRMEVVRADTPTTTPALRAVTGNTRHVASRCRNAGVVKDLVRTIIRRYGSIIQQAGALHNVPAELLINKLFIENPDLKASVVTGGGATGLMQIAPGTAADCLRTEYRAGNLLPAEVAYFQAALGAGRWAALLAGRGGLSTADLQNPAFNIHVGTLAFGQYLRKYTNAATGEVYIYKAAANYNRGDRAEYANARCSTPDQVINFRGPGKTSTPRITQQYIMCYCGPNSPLDFLTRNPGLI